MLNYMLLNSILSTIFLKNLSVFFISIIPLYIVIIYSGIGVYIFISLCYDLIIGSLFKPIACSVDPAIDGILHVA